MTYDWPLLIYLHVLKVYYFYEMQKYYFLQQGKMFFEIFFHFFKDLMFSVMFGMCHAFSSGIVRISPGFTHQMRRICRHFHPYGALILRLPF